MHQEGFSSLGKNMHEELITAGPSVTDSEVLRQPLKQVWRDAPSHLNHVDSAAVTLRAISYILVALGYAVIAAVTSYAGTLGIVVGLACSTFVLMVVSSWRRHYGWPAPKQLSDLKTLPSASPQLAVQVDLGKDCIESGLITFVDGWLHFEGVHTDFSLHRKECTVYSESKNGLTIGVAGFGPVKVRGYLTFEGESQEANFARLIGNWVLYRGAIDGVGTLLLRAKPQQRILIFACKILGGGILLLSSLGCMLVDGSDLSYAVGLLGLFGLAIMSHWVSRGTLEG